MSDLPKDFKRATWRGTTSVSMKEICISFDVEDGTTVRLCLQVDSARHAAETLLEYLGKAQR